MIIIGLFWSIVSWVANLISKKNLTIQFLISFFSDHYPELEDKNDYVKNKQTGEIFSVGHQKPIAFQLILTLTVSR